MNKAIRFLEGFLFGGLLGASLALLLAPASGEELRYKMQGEVDRIRAEVSKAASDRRIELEQQLEVLRAPHKPGRV